MNINVPAGEPHGVVVARLGKRIYRDRLQAQGDGRYFIYGADPGYEDEEGTDLVAVAAGHVAVTPVHLDLTHHDGIGRCRPPTWRGSRAGGAGGRVGGYGCLTIGPRWGEGPPVAEVTVKVSAVEATTLLLPMGQVPDPPKSKATREVFMGILNTQMSTARPGWCRWCSSRLR